MNIIPPGDVPFTTVHIDHYGPVDKEITVKKYAFFVIDAFTKFVKLYATKSTLSQEAINCLETYIIDYKKLISLVSNRSSSFTSNEFTTYLSENYIKHILIAIDSLRANG